MTPLLLAALIAARPATFGARCSSYSELLGHPVPAYVDDAHGITNMYPLTSAALPKGALLGYIYSTAGGDAFFVATLYAYQMGVSMTADAQPILVGKNEDIRTLSRSLVAHIQKVLKVHKPIRFIISGPNENGACFSKDWDGTIPP